MTVEAKRCLALGESRLLKEIDQARQAARANLEDTLRRERGQFLTPLPVAAFMAALFAKPRKELRLLDAGAGAGILSAATIVAYINRVKPPRFIKLTAFEIDPVLLPFLRHSYALCASACEKKGIEFSCEILQKDFIEEAVNILRADMFAPAKENYNISIVNPPYSKISNDPRTRQLLSSVGIETSNLYTAFLALIARLLNKGGELVAITPRSFCNGPYFRPFRQQFLDNISLRRLHLFESRRAAFKDDAVLQETIITHGVRTTEHPNRVTISKSDGTTIESLSQCTRAYSDVVSLQDSERIIHITSTAVQARCRREITQFNNTLHDLNLTVSTGRVVDFRSREYLRASPGQNTVPLIYPCHFNGGYIDWPKLTGRKPNAIIRNQATESLLIPAGVYVLVKRFSSKEQKRRVVACIYEPSRINADFLGFENHVNYFHSEGHGIPLDVAQGLAAFLNSTAVDVFFRQFNGHTQVNASDLKRLRFPSRAALARLGLVLKGQMPEQETLDHIVRKELVK